ncbi:MAG: hypothetical protein AAF598_01065 [Bacteroidota bacterium]
MLQRLKYPIFNYARPAILAWLGLFLGVLVAFIFPAALGDLRQMDASFFLPDYLWFPSFGRFREIMALTIGEVGQRYLVFLWSVDLVLFIVLPVFFLFAQVWLIHQLFGRVRRFKMLFLLAFSVMVLNVLENGLLHLLIGKEDLLTRGWYFLFSALSGMKILLLIGQTLWLAGLSAFAWELHLHFFTLLKTSLKNGEQKENGL